MKKLAGSAVLMLILQGCVFSTGGGVTDPSGTRMACMDSCLERSANGQLCVKFQEGARESCREFLVGDESDGE